MAHDRLGSAAAQAHQPVVEHPVGGDAPSAAVQLSEIEPLHVLGVRVLPGSDLSWVESLHACGVTRLPSPGRYEGEAVRVLWRSPSQYWLVTRQPDRLHSVVTTLTPGANADAYAVDHSEGTVGFELGAEDVDGVLARLMDASAIPRTPGQATRARCADVAVVLMRIDERRLWMLVDRPVVPYMTAWLGRAVEHTTR